MVQHQKQERVFLWVIFVTFILEPTPTSNRPEKTCGDVDSRLKRGSSPLLLSSRRSLSLLTHACYTQPSPPHTTTKHLVR